MVRPGYFGLVIWVNSPGFWRGARVRRHPVTVSEGWEKLSIAIRDRQAGYAHHELWRF
jgi:hypothetical protein